MEPVKPQKKRTALNVTKLGMPAFNPANKGGPPALLRVDVWQNNPRLVLDTKDPNLAGPENRFGRIEAAMTTADLFALTYMLRQFAMPGEADKKMFMSLGHARVNGEKAKEITSQAAVWVGRDAEGHVFLSVINETNDRFPKIKLILGPNDARYSKWHNSDGSPMSKVDMSRLYAHAWSRMIEQLVPCVLDTHYEIPVPPQGGYNNRGGNGGGGYNNRGGNSGGNRPNNNGGAPPKDEVMDDDLPFATNSMHHDMTPSKAKRLARTDF